MSYPAVRISRRAAERLHNGHVWVYSSDVTDRASANGGEVVRIEDPRGKFLGLADYSGSSQIALRLLTRNTASIDRDFWRSRLQSAIEHRRSIDSSEAYRLVFSEGDLLPGLIVDRYGDVLVLQALTQAMDRRTPEIVTCLEELLTPRGILLRNDATVRAKESLPREIRTATGEVPDRVALAMNGGNWIADLREGHKTGMYLDQRENYLAARRYARGRALDCFTSAGGFALHLAQSCDSVDAVDASASSLARAKENRDLNGIANVAFHEADVFQFLGMSAMQRRRFDTIVLDPPAFAKSKSSIDKAVAGYKEINLKALRLLDRGGILVTCSCSHHVSEAAFLETLAGAANDAGKTLRILERRVQAGDHPILLTVPESLYLKCVIAEVVA